MRILFVEDEKYLAEAIIQMLKKNNYTIDHEYDGEAGLSSGLTDIYDIIILDIMLPLKDGITVLKELRSNNIKTPVLLLTARGEVRDRIRGLDCGADDYLSKSFHSEELLARLRALARRKADLFINGVLEYGDIILNPHSLSLQCGERQLNLTLKESQLLELLIKYNSHICSKERIIEKLWGFETETENSHVEVQVSLLRKKLSRIESAVTINTIRNMGYVLKL